MRTTLAATLAIAWASLLVGAAAIAQPIQWQHTIPSAGPGFFLNAYASAALAQDGSGNVYVGRLGAAFESSVSRVDATGVLVWTTPVPGFLVCVPTCGTGLVGFAADASGAYVAGNTHRGPMACAVGCGYGFVSAAAALDGAGSSIYATPFTQPVSAGVHGLAAVPGGGAVVAGYDASGGLVVRIGAQPLERRYGSAMTHVAAHASGATLVAGGDSAGEPFIRRYSSVGDVDWTRTRTGMSGCALFAVDAAGRVACAGPGDVTVYDAAGAPLWGPAALVVGAMAFDGAGHLWVTGQTCSGTGHHCAATLAKYDTAGARVAFDAWRIRHAGMSGMRSRSDWRETST